MDPKKHEALSVPNLITYFRLLLVPVFVVLYFEGKYRLALACLIVSGLSDVADGFIARRFDMVTDIGKVVDPVADKLTQAAMIFCVAWRHPILWALFALLAVKELVMLVWGWVALRRTGTVNSAKWYGKVCTFVLYASMAVLVLFPGLPAAARDGIVAVCAAVMLMSLVLYSAWYIRYLRGSAGKTRRRALDHHVLRSHASMVLTEIVAVVLLVCAALAVVYRNDLTVEAIVGFTPGNLWLAALVFMGLYAAKSMTVVVYVKLLYIAAGVVFPLPVALAVNLLGSVIELTIPYLLGRGGGRQAAEFVLQRRPKLRRVTALRQRSNLWFSMFLRVVGVLPVDPVSIYLGACGMPYGPYLLGSLVGVTPTLAICTVFGTAVQDPSSPRFIVSAALFVAAQLAAAVVFAVWIRKNKTTAVTAEKEADTREPSE